MTVTVPPEYEEFIKDKVSSGSYASSTEVVQEALRMFRECEELQSEQLDDLRKAVAVGLEQARRGELLDGERVFQELFDQLDEQH